MCLVDRCVSGLRSSILPQRRNGTTEIGRPAHRAAAQPSVALGTLRTAEARRERRGVLAEEHVGQQAVGVRQLGALAGAADGPRLHLAEERYMGWTILTWNEAL